MVEAGANEVSEDVIVRALQAAHDAIRSIVAMIDGWRRDWQEEVPVAAKVIDPRS